MKLSEVVEAIDGKICCGQDALLDTEVRTAAASDLMSEILARSDAPDVLLTRLNNAQSIHTSSIFGTQAVVVVRGRPIADIVIETACEEEIVLLSTPLSLFEACGRLYEQGLRSAG